MKKTISTVLLVLCMLFGLAACGTEEPAAPNVIGTWVLESVNLNGVTHVDAEYLGDYDYSFTFEEDGTATADVLGVRYSTTYSVKDGWITFADADLASVKLEITEDSLKMEVSPVGAGLVFTRKESPVLESRRQ